MRGLVYQAMKAKQGVARLKVDEVYQRYIWDSYGKVKVGASGYFFVRCMDFPGPYYIVYADGPDSVQLCSSYTESWTRSLKNNLRRVFNLNSVTSKISYDSQIQIAEHIAKIDFPDKLMSYNDLVRIGLYPPDRAAKNE